MDFSEQWKQILSQCPDIEGGAYFSADGVLITCAKFGNSEADQNVFTHCAAILAIARQVSEYTERDEVEALILEGERGYIVLIPFLDRAIFAVLARKEAKLGLVLLDMHRAIDDLFGPGLANEMIFSPRPPKHGTAHADPEFH
jgi:uncharacterized protein